MGILEISGLTFLYLSIGYALGKITYHEYKNDTPTKELDRFGKFKRLLLFPISYHIWNRRNEFSGDVGPPGSAVAMLKEKSYKISMFLWPLKLIPIVMSVVELLFFLTWSALEGTTLIPDLIEKKVKRLKRAKIKLLSSSIDLSWQINEIEIFLNNLQKRKKSLDDENQRLYQRISQLEKNLIDWKTALSPEKPDQVTSIVDGLSQEITVSKQKSEKLKKDISVLTQKEQELEGAIKTLARCQKTMELKVHITGVSGNKLIKEDSVASLAGTTASSADSLMVECKNLLSEAS